MVFHLAQLVLGHCSDDAITPHDVIMTAPNNEPVRINLQSLNVAHTTTTWGRFSSNDELPTP